MFWQNWNQMQSFKANRKEIQSVLKTHYAFEIFDRNGLSRNLHTIFEDLYVGYNCIIINVQSQPMPTHFNAG